MTARGPWPEGPRARIRRITSSRAGPHPTLSPSLPLRGEESALRLRSPLPTLFPTRDLGGLIHETCDAGAVGVRAVADRAGGADGGACRDGLRGPDQDEPAARHGDQGGGGSRR